MAITLSDYKIVIDFDLRIVHTITMLKLITTIAIC